MQDVGTVAAGANGAAGGRSSGRAVRRKRVQPIFVGMATVWAVCGILTGICLVVAPRSSGLSRVRHVSVGILAAASERAMVAFQTCHVMSTLAEQDGVCLPALLHRNLLLPLSVLSRQ
jgi:hypothetical protein